MPAEGLPPAIVSSVAGLAQGTEAWLVDVWGVMHNGIKPFAAAVEACRRFRAEGGIVVLLSNAPRPASAVERQLSAIGVAAEAYDAIITSGDVARHLVREAPRGLYHLGPPRDLSLYEGLDVVLAGPDTASCVVCTGLFDDETEGPDDYGELLAGLARREVAMICANPDVTVERGSQTVYCAGALARRYLDLGGKVSFAGKPYLPIYTRAFETIDACAGRSVPKVRMLAIGDGAETDIKGARGAGVSALFIASGIDVPAGPEFDAAWLARLFADPTSRPLATMRALAW